MLNKAKRALSTLAVLVASMLPMKAEANAITQYNADYNNPIAARFQIDLRNNDNGATYNSYDLKVFESLKQALYELPHNQTNYLSANNLSDNWTLAVQPDPVGEINNKWQVNTTSYDPVQVTHFGLGYEQWLATQQNPNQDMMSLVLSIPNSQLDGNGNGFSTNDLQDYQIIKAASPTPAMGIGHAGFGNDFPAQGYEYLVVPNGNTITPTAGPNGTITPNLEFLVKRGSNTNITAQANPYYHINNVNVDGQTFATNGNTYVHNFNNVTSNHTINATFAENKTSKQVPEWWLAQYGFTNDFENAQNQDIDLDGLSMWEEYVADTDPTDSNTEVRVTGIMPTDSGVAITFPTSTNRTYEVQYTADLRSPQSWQTLETIVPTNEMTTVIDPNANSTRFYRTIVRRTN